MGGSASAGALLSACTGAEPDGQREEIRISIVGAVLNNPFWDLIARGARAAGRDLAGTSVTYAAPEEFSLANISALIQGVIAGSPDGIAIDYRGREFEEVTRLALDRGIAIQFFNNFEGFPGLCGWPRLRLVWTRWKLPAEAGKRFSNI